MTHPRDERGHVSAFMTAIMTAVIAAMGLVWDAGGMLIQRGQASSIAHEAARAGANEIDLAHFRSRDSAASMRPRQPRPRAPTCALPRLVGRLRSPPKQSP